MVALNAHFNKLKGLRIIHLNIRSLINKLDQLKYYISVFKPMIICLSETWLNNHINDIEINIEGFHVYRRDRNDKRGGRVAIYVIQKPTLTSNLVVKNYNLEELTIELKFTESKHFYISCIYRPPDHYLFNDKYIELLSDYTVD
jgi:hypothetical protein